MAVKINTLSEEEISSIGDAFAYHKYDESEFGMAYLAKSRRAVSDYISAYARMMIAERLMYSTSDDHEAFIVFRSSDHKLKSSSALELLKTIPGAINIGHSLKAAKACIGAEKNYVSILSKLKIPYIYVDMVVVKKEFQGQGFMRQLMEIAFEEGRRHAMPVVLDTDAKLKKAKYEHLGMKCVTTLHFTDGVELYSMIYEPDNMPKEWKSEQVLEDARILSLRGESVWDRFAPVYTGFVTGTPGNRKAYEAMYRRIRRVVKDKEVLELATGPGVIAKQIATETKSIVATDFSDKMLAVARRGVIPSNLSFEKADAGNLPYDDESFDVVIIANALHVIPGPEKVLAEIKRVLRPGGLLIAPNFIHDNDKRLSEFFSKTLSAAGVSFEAKWDADSYISFLNENGFDVIRSKQLPSTIPLLYAECITNNNSFVTGRNI